jgi:glutathione S-transferase
MLTLYSHANRTAANTLKIRAALAEAGAEYAYVAVDLAKGEHKKPEFLAINPHGKVPVLTDDDFTLPESDAILWYVAEKFPKAGLLPSDAKGRARVLQWCDFASTGLYVASYEIHIHTAWAEPANRSAWVTERAKGALERGMAVLDKQMTGRTWIATDALTIADFAVAAVLHMIQSRPQLELRTYPAAFAHYERVAARPAWAKAISETP